ncbi:unnamed protein product [Cuscuta europaea]|uniref:Uncharacterized protein n=1 Tax=Cuscuta europaea TaxID=41803 RepID=A0A9P0ZZH2_CUSEU|nr:unnamed protein product [Cuscuta europaea]
MEIEAVVDSSMLLKIQVKKENLNNYSSIFSVMRFTKDVALIEKFVGKHGDDKVGSSDNEMSTPVKFKDTENNRNDAHGAKKELLGEFSSSASSKKVKVVVKNEKEA